MDTQTCEHLLAAAKTGDLNAVEQLLMAISDSLHTTARCRLGSRLQPRVDTSDVVQQSLFEVCQSLSEFRGRTAAEWHAWTRNILHHNVLNEIDRHLHAQKRTVTRTRSFAEEGTEPRDFEYVLRQRQSSPPQQAQDNESRQSLEMAITDLPDAQQTAIRMRYIENMPVTEIADGMSRSNTAVAGLLKRGLKQLRTRMVTCTETT
ncbi:MAG: sigma-70 family RNA polymerase sigma factor [Fuerstiella sp.]|nr:sigma-70 family RNA polymerase sigma factor [Fuerstiella sp.]MCP4857673.1 sigma-70 family RNA polymerase sigma factor [Fuerstiella sp.]